MPTRIICSDCGEFNHENASYCHMCGSSIAAKRIAVPPPPHQRVHISTPVPVAPPDLISSPTTEKGFSRKWIEVRLILTANIVLLVIWALMLYHPVEFYVRFALCIAVFSSIPYVINILTSSRNRLLRFVLESVLLILITIFASVWMFGLQSIGSWLFVAGAIIFIIEAGGHLIERYIVSIGERIRRAEYLTPFSSVLDQVKKHFSQSRIIYTSVPVGVSIGLTISFIQGHEPIDIALTSINAVLMMAVLLLLLLVLVGSIQLTRSLYIRHQEYKSTAALTELAQTTILYDAKGREMTKIGIYKGKEITSKDPKDMDLSLSLVSSDIRKIYLYDTVHNTLLLSLMLFAILRIQSYTLDLRWSVLTLLVFVFIFSQSPYVIGQYFLHEKHLEKYEGIDRSEMMERIKKVSPLFPSWDFFATLTTAGTSGGILYYLVDELIKRVLN